jgi:hypothetical protein
VALLDTVTALCTSSDTQVILSYTLRPVLRSKSNPSDYLCPVSFDEVRHLRCLNCSLPLHRGVVATT